MKPFSHKIYCDNQTPVSLYLNLALRNEYAFLFESAEVNKSSGRFSFIGFGAAKKYIFPAAAGTMAANSIRLNKTAKSAKAPNPAEPPNPLEILKKEYQKISYQADPDLPSLQAGFVGYFAYEIVRHFEKINLPLPNQGAPDTIPEGIFFLPKNLLIFDHHQHTLTFVAYSKKDLDELVKIFQESESASVGESGVVKIENSLNKPRIGNKSVHVHTLSVEKHDTDSAGSKCVHVKTFTAASDFKKIVNIAKEKIVEGEIFQIVLSQNFSEPVEYGKSKSLKPAPFDLYRRLRLLSPSPYMFYLQFPDFSIIGSSPETLIKTEKNRIILRPIAGTRRRGKTATEDQKLAMELINDPKEKAEHMMLVDLGRNDLGRVAEPGTVKIDQLMRVQKYSHVMHLVSEISGKRRREQTLFEIFRAAFPAGTLTGAPKIRAMEIIAKLEAAPRQIYGGAVGYFDLSGNMDFAIAIRTMVYKNGTINLRAGAGIVYDSVPKQENMECINKARGPLSAVN